MRDANAACPLCGRPVDAADLDEVHWADPAVLHELRARRPHWRRADGACPACVQDALLHVLLRCGDDALHEQIQSVWPLDARAAFGALPTPLRLHADPRFTGCGVTLALIDVGFYPHADLVWPRNRIRAWVDATHEPVESLHFGPDDAPIWPECETRHNRQWHGTMTSVAAAGNGFRSHGLYRGLASAADVVLIQVRSDHVEKSNESIVRALRWVAENGTDLGVRVVNVSLGGFPVSDLAGNPIDAAVAGLTDADISVTVAAGNDGVRYLAPPATAPAALTVGGLDDQNTFDHAAVTLWHSNYGDGLEGAPKPELVAPSIWVVAPVLPGTDLADEAQWLFEQRHRNGQHTEIERRIAELKLVTPHYQHVDGTSFAAPLTASAIACMVEANSDLTPPLIRQILMESAQFLPDVSRTRQGAGALAAGPAVSMALHHQHDTLEAYVSLPQVTSTYVRFVLHAHDVQSVWVVGSWDDWSTPLALTSVEEGVWAADLPRPTAGRYTYKYVIDGEQWLDDPANPAKTGDGYGGFNSVLYVE